MKMNSIGLENSTVMIVDDNPDNIRVIESFLRDASYHTVVATSGEIALKRIDYAHPDIILLDILIPGISEFEVCKIIKESDATKDIPVIFMTALTESEDKVQGFAVGAVDFISKPIQKEELLARIQTHLKIYKYQEYLENMVSQRTGELESRLSSLKKEIAERKLAQDELHKSEKLQQDLLNNSSTVIYIKDLEGKYIFVNRAFEKVFDQNNIIIQGKDDFEIFDREIAEGFKINDLKVLETDKLMEFEEVSQEDDGIHIYISVKFPLKNSNGESYAICGISTDITKRKETEKELITLKKYLSNIINSMPSVLIGINGDGKISQWNKTAEDETGFTNPKVIGKSIYDILTYRGCWNCWMKTPGKCAIQDDFEQVVSRIPNVDKILYISPIISGYESAVLKRAKDRSIPTIHPYIRFYKGEMHHKLRYKEMPEIHVMMHESEDTTDEEMNNIQHTYDRMALNFGSEVKQFKIINEAEGVDNVFSNI